MIGYWKRGGKGIILSGISAGAISWFRYGISDSRRFTNPDADLIRVSGLNFIPALLCPHYDVEAERKADLKKLMKRTAGVAIALENCSAVEIVDDKFRIIDSNSLANAYKIYWKSGKYVEDKIKKSNDFSNLSALLQKD